MNLVACMLVGNEVELVDAAIQNAFRHGVDAFVIVETASSDGTTDILRAYADDPRFDISFLSHDEVYSKNFINPAQVWADIVACAKSRFDADWILRMDADEFIMTRSGSLKDLCAGCEDDAFSLERFNVLVPPSCVDLAAAAKDYETLSQLQVMACPFPNKTVMLKQNESIPLILTMVGGKTLCRAEVLHGFSPGGHAGMNISSETLKAKKTGEAWIVHFWFTTEDRFLRKCQFIVDITQTVRTTQKGGWQWNRWGSIADESVESAKDEFKKQLIDQHRLEILSQQGRIARADQAFDTSVEHSDAITQMHILQLGWGN